MAVTGIVGVSFVVKKGIADIDTFIVKYRVLIDTI